MFESLENTRTSVIAASSVGGNISVMTPPREGTHSDDNADQAQHNELLHANCYVDNWRRMFWRWTDVTELLDNKSDNYASHHTVMTSLRLRNTTARLHSRPQCISVINCIVPLRTRPAALLQPTLGRVWPVIVYLGLTLLRLPEVRSAPPPWRDLGLQL